MPEPSKPEPAKADPPTSRRADAIANRQRLIEAAREAFAELGVAAEVKDIAERAGVGVGTMYRHFGSKEDLLRAIVVEAIAECNQRIGDSPEGDPIAVLRRAVAALFWVADQYGWLFDAALRGHLPERIRDGLEDGLEEQKLDVRLAAVLNRGVEAGALDPGLDVDIAASMLLGLAMAWNLRGLSRLMTVEEAVERTLDILLHGAARREP